MVAVLESRNEKQYIGYSHSSVGKFTAYNFAQFVQEAYRQNPTVYACIQQYISAFNACPIIIKRGEEVVNNDRLIKLLNAVKRATDLLVSFKSKH